MSISWDQPQKQHRKPVISVSVDSSCLTLKSGFLGTGWVTLGMSLNLPVPWHPHLHHEKGADTRLTGQLCGARAGSQKALHTVSGHSQLHPSVICPVNKDYLTLMSSPILDIQTTDDRQEPCS